MRYEQIKPLLDEQVLDEVKMSPSALQKFANSPEAEGMLMGIEFEMCVPNVAVDDDSGEGEYDYDMDERAYSISDIVDFFQNGENSTLSRNGADRLRNEMWDQYMDWVLGAISDNLDTDELEERIRERLKDDLDEDEFVEQAREELGDDAVDDAVEERARELADEYVDSLMGDSREYDDAYDDIRQEMEDDMRNDGYYEEAWLNDIGVDSMSDAEREWSLDWPHWRSYGGDGEMDVETVGDEFGRAMGLEFVNTSNNYHGARRDGKNWIIEPDSSIDAEQGDGGLEFVSPPMPIKQGLEMIQKMYKWAKDNGCYTNKSTGLHMNISVPDMTIDKLDYVKLALFLGDEYVLKKFGREYNSYCKSAMSKIKDRVKPEDVPSVLAQMKQHLNSLASKTIHSGITDKYTSINTKDNYVEFRGPGGDYLDMNPFEVANTVLRLAMSLRIATEPEAYKQEYAKKLYKLVEQDGGDWTDPNNSVALFSRYALGEINKAELVDNVRQAQIARKEKKGEEQQYWVMNKDGTGGKQMVFATSETEAIIKGGKQMGMNREASISKLKAEVKVDRIDLEGMSQDQGESTFDRKFYPAGVKDLIEALPAVWRDWVMNIPNKDTQLLAQGRQTARSGQLVDDGTMTQQSANLIVNLVNDELAYRAATDTEQEDGSVELQFAVAGPGTVDLDVELPLVWREWVDDIRNKTAENLVSKKQGLENNEYNLTRAQKEKVLGIINSEIARRSGADTNSDREEVLASLPDNVREWLGNIRDHSDMGIINILNNPAVTQDLTDQQAAYFRLRLKQELRRRGIDPSEAQPSSTSASQSSREIYDSLPQGWQNWFANISNHSDRNIQQNLDAINDPENSYSNNDLSAEQRNFIVNTMTQELRRRGVGASTQDAAAQQQALVRDDPVTSNDPEAQSPIAQDGPGMWMVGNHTYGRETFRANNKDAAIQAYAERNGITDIDAFKAERSFVAQLMSPDQGELDLREMRRLAGLV